jgi:hypothetical protein
MPYGGLVGSGLTRSVFHRLTGKFLDSEAFGQEGQALLAKQMYPLTTKA